MRSRSVEALQLDARTRQIISTLKYLCQTQNGVPLSELAEFVSENLRKMGEEEFTQELVVLGKNKDDIKIWLKHTKTAEKNLHRKLSTDGIEKSITRANPILESYGKLYHQLADGDLQGISASTHSLMEHITEYFGNDPYFVQATNEIMAVPFWDIDENYGGS